MTLLELHIDVARVADALEKIVFLLEKLVFPPLPVDVKVHQATLDDLHIITPDDTERMKADQMRFAEIHRVVPGSEAFTDELRAWEAEQRRMSGEKWKAPDWVEILTSAECIRAQGGGGAVREQAAGGAAGSAAEVPEETSAG